MRRAFDLVVSGFCLVLLLPLMGILAIVIRICLGSPVFFRQFRPGLNEKKFELIKFRTMLDLRDSNDASLPDSDRITGLGRFLRSTSLDELPELWNVVRGDMSLVGPRPLLVEYLPLYSVRQARRHEVLPGLTGLAQISGRNVLSWQDKLELDVWYVENRSTSLDLAILCRTIGPVFKREGISATNSETTIPFTGN